MYMVLFFHPKQEARFTKERDSYHDLLPQPQHAGEGDFRARPATRFQKTKTLGFWAMSISYNSAFIRNNVLQQNLIPILEYLLHVIKDV